MNTDDDLIHEIRMRYGQRSMMLADAMDSETVDLMQQLAGAVYRIMDALEQRQLDHWASIGIIQGTILGIAEARVKDGA